MKALKNFKWGYLILFILLAIVGVCFIAFTETLETLALIIGLIATAYGIIYAVLAFADKDRGPYFALKVIIAIAAIAAGIVTIIFRQGAIEVLASLFGLFLVIDGAFKLQTTAMSKRYNLDSWWVMLIPAIIVITGGFISVEMRLQNADGQATWLSYILGTTIIIDAIANLLSAFYTTSYEKRLTSKIREELIAEQEKSAAAAEALENKRLEKEEKKLRKEAKKEQARIAREAKAASREQKKSKPRSSSGSEGATGSGEGGFPETSTFPEINEPLSSDDE